MLSQTCPRCWYQRLSLDGAVIGTFEYCSACSDWTTAVFWGNSKTASRWRCHWNFWILLRMFWLNHSCVLRQFFDKINHCYRFLNVFHAIYNSFPISCKSILWSKITKTFKVDFSAATLPFCCCVYRLYCLKALIGWAVGRAEISACSYSQSTCGAIKRSGIWWLCG